MVTWHHGDKVICWHCDTDMVTLWHADMVKFWHITMVTWWHDDMTQWDWKGNDLKLISHFSPPHRFAEGLPLLLHLHHLHQGSLGLGEDPWHLCSGVPGTPSGGMCKKTVSPNIKITFVFPFFCAMVFFYATWEWHLIHLFNSSTSLCLTKLPSWWTAGKWWPEAAPWPAVLYRRGSCWS